MPSWLNGSSWERPHDSLGGLTPMNRLCGRPKLGVEEQHLIMQHRHCRLGLLGNVQGKPKAEEP